MTRTLFNARDEPIDVRFAVWPIGALEVGSQARPVRDVCAHAGIGVRLGESARNRVAVEIFKLRRDFAHDARLALGRQRGQRQPLANESVPVTHPSRR